MKKARPVESDSIGYWLGGLIFHLFKRIPPNIAPRTPSDTANANPNSSGRYIMPIITPAIYPSINIGKFGSTFCLLRKNYRVIGSGISIALVNRDCQSSQP